MSQIKIEVAMQLLNAATICAAKKDIRFYLMGIAINRGHVVSTDGHRAFACPVEGISPDLEFIIPTEAVNAFIKKVPATSRKRNCCIVFDPITKRGEINYGTDVCEVFNGIDGKFPDWMRAFPRAKAETCDGMFPQFNWQYLADFQKIHKALGGNGVGTHVYPSSTNTVATVEFSSQPFQDARGYVMPIRS